MKRFQPDFGSFARIVCGIAILASVFLLCISIVYQDILALVLIAAIIATTTGLLLNYYLAVIFYNAAVDKGYYEKKYFFIPFFLPAIGYLVVIALPNTKMQKAIFALQQSMDKPHTPVRHINLAMTYTTENELREYLRKIVEYPEMSGYREILQNVMSKSFEEMRDTLRWIAEVY